MSVALFAVGDPKSIFVGVQSPRFRALSLDILLSKKPPKINQEKKIVIKRLPKTFFGCVVSTASEYPEV